MKLHLRLETLSGLIFQKQQDRCSKLFLQSVLTPLTSSSNPKKFKFRYFFSAKQFNKVNIVIFEAMTQLGLLFNIFLKDNYGDTNSMVILL